MSWTRIEYFWKMSVCLWVCMCMHVWQKFCGKCNSRVNKQNFMKFYIKFYPNTHWCLWTMSKNRFTGGAVVAVFPKFFGYVDLGFYTQKNVLLNQQKFGRPNKVFRLNMRQWKFCLNEPKKYCWFFFAIPTKKNLHRQQKTGIAN